MENKNIVSASAVANVVSLVTYMRAGSKLFHSLLDWHPQVISFPRTLQFDRFWKTVADRREDPEYCVDAFIECHPRFFSGASWFRFNKYDRADRLGDAMNETFSVDEEAFKSRALERLAKGPIERKQLFLALHLAYHEACGRPLKDGSIIINHIHDIDFLDEIRACSEDFPSSKLVVTMRHPIEGTKSSVNWMKIQNTLSCGEAYHHVLQAIRGTSRLVRAFPELDIRVVPFEQLQRHHRAVMENFARWAGVDWDESFMKSTLHGKLWWSNGKIARNGTDPKWKSCEPRTLLERNDWLVLSAITGRRLVRYGYLDRIPRINIAALVAAAMLPSAGEWEVLRCMVSPAYWKEIVENIADEMKDPRLADYDFYSKTKLREADKEKPQVSSLLRFCGQCVRHIRMVNPVSWFFYNFRRIAARLTWIVHAYGDVEVLPPSLYEVDEVGDRNRSLRVLEVCSDNSSMKESGHEK